ncbi:P1 family peptidase [Isoptericola sp. b441]|uniref:P1 family peptidase n=1 Tax=Actinotalea lenta TaxID=3064654 RepID=A0ABT9DAD4_9CELL|nr:MULTISPECIES: P1 family peptidase [unclassified Isoptericola]MDO8107870.1 P1 family peptidase [Isoptericola sp. b441]MDO8120460.1 P1 family peptidase [Isoptericola sp. b490]
MEHVHGSITDVPGVRVGQVQRDTDGWLTGVTVVLPPPGTVGGVDVRGGGPGTHETDALDPRTLVATVDAVVLTGGSAYGLVTAHGAQRWCAEHGRGFPVSDRPGEVVPIVPAAAIFDLGRGGVFAHHPTEQMGYDAAAAAGAAPEHGAVARGSVGAGTGAAIAGQQFKGGVGTASIRIAGGCVVGALVVVNAAGAPLPRTGEPPQAAPWAVAGSETNTTLAVVVTDAALDPAETSRTATAAHDGLARALDPVHTLADGDTVFALATGRFELPSDRPARVASLVALQAAAATAVRLAVLDGVAHATPARTDRVDLPVWPHPLS